MLIIVASAFVGSVGGLNQSSLRKLIAYSSINHLGWLLAACYFGVKYIIIYFSIYIVTNLVLVGVIHYRGIFYLSQVYYYSGPRIKSLVIIITWFSFGGLPPFVGFFGKWLLIRLMLEGGLGVLCTFIVIIRLVSLYYYTRICYVVISQSGGMPLMMPSKPLTG